MLSDDIAIRVDNLSKCYHIYEKPVDRLKQFILPRLQRLLGIAPKQYYKEFWALKDVSFEVKKGQTLGIIGRNGSGKSTLLQLICGILNPTSGSVKVSGRVAAILELGSGFNPEFTGRENVYLNASLFGLTASDIDQRYQQILEFADIGDFIDQPVKTYSSGMLVRLAFAVIAHVDANILLIDEALAVGDTFFKQKCMSFIRNFMRTGIVIFVGHDTGLMLNICDYSMWLHSGELIEFGVPKKIIENYISYFYDYDSHYSTEPTTLLDQKVEKSERFGSGGAKILSVLLSDVDGRVLSMLSGGEKVQLIIQIKAIQSISNFIVGFQVKDRLGQVIFGENTYSSYKDSQLRLEGGEAVIVSFQFLMPFLCNGDYVITAAVADGSQDEHAMLEWIHDAITFNVSDPTKRHGIVQIPMMSISVSKG